MGKTHCKKNKIHFPGKLSSGKLLHFVPFTHFIKLPFNFDKMSFIQMNTVPG